MNDIVTRLRRRAIATDAVPAGDLMDEAADEIARLRGVICDLHAQESQRLQPPTLTDAEREARLWTAKVYQVDQA
jgi:hypothetical protein